MRGRSSATASQARGSFCDLHELIGLRASAAHIRLQPPPVRNTSAGMHAGARRGRGIEFEELRTYEPGDDVRTIDWRVSARSASVHTRVFREERERPVFLLVDQRREMFFGSRCTFKSVQATHAAALLAWATLAGGDRIGGLVLGEHGRHEVRPRRSHRAVLELLRSCTEFNHRLGIPVAMEEGATLATGFAALRRIVRPGSLVVVISDFAVWDDASARELHLLGRHAESCAVHVHDPLERALPAVGTALASDGQRRVTIDTRDARVRQQHARHFERKTAEVAAAFARLGAAFIELPTDAPAASVLGSAFIGNAR